MWTCPGYARRAVNVLTGVRVTKPMRVCSAAIIIRPTGCSDKRLPQSR